MGMKEEEFDVNLWLADFLSALENWFLDRSDKTCEVFRLGE